MKDMEVEKKKKMVHFRHMSCKEIQRGWGSGKGQEMCSEEQTHSTAAVWPEGAEAAALRHKGDRSTDLLSPCSAVPRLLALLGRESSVRTGKGGPSTTSHPQLPSQPCPAPVHAPRWKNSLNELAVVGSALAVGCAGQKQNFFTSWSAASNCWGQLTTQQAEQVGRAW